MNEIEQAIVYFEDAIRESDEIIAECSPMLQAELIEQKTHFVVALAALRKQSPLPVDFIHKEGEEAALTICPTCENRLIVNFKLYKELNKDWYCKHCGQQLFLESEAQDG